MSCIVPLESFLNARLLGQAEAVREFSSAVERAESGPLRQGRLRGFVLLLGPTGTGKTEMVKLTASYLYGAEAATRMRRLDMGEFQHRDSVQRLYGSAGERPLLGEAIDALNAQGGGILLLDEIEKAYPDLLMALLSFDDARATMADGVVKDLSACYVIMTSNIGAAEAAQMVSNGYSAIRRKVIHEAEQVFRKETVARFTSSIVMNTLSFETQQQIARILLKKELLLQSEHRHYGLEVAGEQILSFLVSKGFSPDLGARNIRKTVERYVGDALRGFDDKGSGLSTAEGDLWSRTLVLHVADDCLVAKKLLRSSPMEGLLSAH